MTNKQILQAWFEQVWEKRDLAAIDHWLSPDAICHGLADDDEPLVGVEQFRRYAEGMMSLFTAMEVEIDDAIEQGEHVAARCTVRATTETGRPVTFQGMCWFTVQNQKLVEGWNQFDFAKMMRQLDSR